MAAGKLVSIKVGGKHRIDVTVILVYVFENELVHICDYMYGIARILYLG